VSNPHISKIYNNYVHSLSTLLPFTKGAERGRIQTPEDEVKFTDVLAELVETHANTIPTLAQGFLECRRYISPESVTAFLDEHLRARIGTRLIAEQHIALQYSSAPNRETMDSFQEEDRNYIGVIDTQLKPADIIQQCSEFVAEICEFKYGVRPKLVIDGQPDTRFAYIPVHLEYIITELLKNAYRATIETGHEKEPIEVTITAAPPSGDSSEAFPPSADGEAPSEDAKNMMGEYCPGVTIRIRDRGGGISPETIPNIWAYSFTTFSEDDFPGVSAGSGNGNSDALNTISGISAGGSSIAGLGYGLPLGRAYAEYFDGGIAVQSLFGWGTDVYLTLRGIGGGITGK
jgi:Mitochondrial branched-chain alpha-ketoacid dehydrogenase kinase/Histidine kinase-, DNA gyrase B-, and HSP90-like ATPase